MSIQKVYQIHLLFNQAVYLFEDLPEDDKFFKDNEAMYNRMVMLCENLSKALKDKQNDRYVYQLAKLKKVVDNIKIPHEI